MSGYTELQITSNYSFLRGASQLEELCAAASVMGYEAIAITDHNTLAGIARAHKRAGEANIRLIVGCRLDLIDSLPLLVYPTNRAAYARLCRLLTLGKSRTGSDGCLLRWADLASDCDGLLAILIPAEADADLAAQLARLHATFGCRASVALTLRRRPNDQLRLWRIAEAARHAMVAPVVTGDVLFHTPERRILQDVVTCIREGCTIDDLGFRRERYADRHLKFPDEMARLYERYPDALDRSNDIAARCTFNLSELTYQYPDETERDGETAQQALERLVSEAVSRRYPEGLQDDVAKQLQHELRLISELEYAPYFLTVNSIVRYARSRDILCQGRGSAANSAVCYVLGITSIDPVRSGLLFERFISEARREPPDIDVDFEHERREEVIQWVYDHYGRDRAALCATVMRFRPRGAVRDVGKVLGLTEDVTGALASQVWGWSEDGVDDEHAKSLNLNLNDRRLRLTLDLARQLIGFPRQLGTHPGGFVLTANNLADLVPIKPAAMQDRQVIEWDKDDIEHLKFMKVDVLGLGMLGCLRRCFELIEDQGGPRLDIASIPAEDPATYEMICKADTLGTFQIESRAQMAMLPRMKPKTFYDLVIEVAIVRPGPIQGDMVHPYLRRRENLEPVVYPKPDLKRVLGKTLGVPLFQEQAMQVAIACAGFTPTEADQLRRSMATFKFTGGVSHFRDKLIDGMVANGYPRDFAEKTFTQIEGFGSYGFPESHAASFALIAYASSWVKCHHPAVFCCALLNSQPMGFYAPAQIVRDAREHGVTILPVCINRSRWDSTIEADQRGLLAVRLGLRLAKGLSSDHGIEIVTRRGQHSYASVEDVSLRAQVPISALERLAEADAFIGLKLDRRQALWAIKGLADTEMPLFNVARQESQPLLEITEPDVALIAMTAGREVVEDYGSIGLSLRQHPMSFLREDLKQRGMVTCEGLKQVRDGRKVIVGGMVLVRQKPGSAKGVMFITTEDETGVANLIIWPSLFEKQRPLILSASMIACHGKVQKEAGIIHVIADRLEDLSDMLRSVGQRDDPFPIRHGRGDGAKNSGSPDHRGKHGLTDKSLVKIDYNPDLRLGSGIKVPTRNFR